MADQQASSAGKNKNRRKTKAAKKKKLEAQNAENQEPAAQGDVNSSKKTSASSSEKIAPEMPAKKENPEDSLDREVQWCIRQVELKLEKQKPTERQMKETARILKVLTDPKAPLIKKRQVMRTNFGDYRKKMAEEEKTAKPAEVPVTIKPGDEDKQKKGTYLKKAAVSDKDSSKENSFQFNFNSTEKSEGSEVKVNGGATCGEITESLGELKVTGISKDSQNGGDEKNTNTENVNYYKMEKTDNAFRFGFSDTSSG